MLDASVWNSLPNIAEISFYPDKETLYKIQYSEPEKMLPYNIFFRKADFTHGVIGFEARREWFGAPRNPHLFVYREVIKADRNCEYQIRNRMELPADDSEWKFVDFLDREDNSCGMLLEHRDGHRGILCETSQILSFSFHVDETREFVTRSYEITAFEEAPVKLEKYISFHSDEEADFIDVAFRECRNAAKTRFDDLKGIGAWEYSGII